MPALFDTYKSPPREDGKVSIHPRLVSPNRYSSDQMMSAQERATTLTRHDLRAALSAVSAYLVDQLSEGGRVHLDGIGTFSIVPHFNKPKFEGDKVSGKDVTFKRVVFTPTQRMQQDIKANIRFEHHRGYHGHEVKEANAMLLLKEYFLLNNSISVREFERLAKVCATRARQLLMSLVQKERLTRRRIGNAYLYEPNPYYFPENEAAAH